ncbi:uncharacterized protein Z520_07860 [Fonsecaea multimorphosa CBS 102226]|uniref:Uncharacterized protein n=1 Tax=Fonsecaea multimorphosa CBS 102226 TaxID=1442371 RepID=A0A0D2K0T1_9EURO|nr:uncharacterized protein Z520_07860 [Fonsecaea multimorphosa CBS 102226]KIX96594.1 hypothetical protein Z520_07860 [Fonsecaea multimorphosa CBS 102226]OAL22106.1 hypothetical protein AYO22_07466 [Fonsecaea multimorphosa]
MASSSSDGPGATPTSLAVVSTAAPKQRSFWDIPTEVRLEIYELLYCQPKPIRLFLNADGRLKRMRINLVPLGGHPDPEIPTQAFRVDKKFYQEASPVLYQRNKFNMNWENLSKFFSKWDQGITSRLEAIDIYCGRGPAWGFVSVIRVLVDKMPGVRELNIIFYSSSRLLAATLETSSAITPCASMFPGPELELILHPEKLSREWNPGMSRPDVAAICKAIREGNAKLADIWPANLPVNNLTRFCAPNLSLIRLSGRISRRVLPKILRHRCLPGDCFWMKVAQGVEEGSADKETGKEEHSCKMSEKEDNQPIGDVLHYKWKAMDPRERTDIPEVNMRQWHPPLTEKEKQKVRDFAKIFESRDVSCQDDKSPSGEHETASDDNDGASEANAMAGGATALPEPESTDHGGTAEERLRDLQQLAFANYFEANYFEDLERRQDLQQLAFADCFENLNSEFLHKDPADVRAALLDTFGPFAQEIFP